MDKAFKIQMDVKNNAQDLQNYVLDLNNWEKEMKEKELELAKQSPNNRDFPPPRNKIKRNKPISEKSATNCKAKKISGYDYSAWDKYDVDKACAELDEENESETPVNDENNSIAAANNENESDKDEEDDEDDEDKLSLIDKAFYEKEMGNQFVKKEQWNNAIRCYTNAINYDSKNAVYYANRSLCFLKLKKSAEVDATTAIQLDKNYIKAYQRRGYARLGLGQNMEAQSDFEEVLRLEPNNTLMKLEINKINEKGKKESNTKAFNHSNLFKSEVPKKLSKAKVEPPKIKAGGSNKNETVKSSPVKSPAETSDKTEQKADSRQLNKGDGDKKGEKIIKKEKSVFKELPSYCKIVYPVQIPPHKRSKEPLRRIEITEKDDFDYYDNNDDDDGRKEVECGTNSSNIVNQNESDKKVITNVQKYDEYDHIKITRAAAEIPRTSVQFQNCWKYISRNPQEAYNYLNRISGKLTSIFENSLESNIFSDMLTFLATDCPEKELSVVYSILSNLSKVKRFSSMTMFMSKEDKANVTKCIMDLQNTKSENDLSELKRLYELQ
ncbi:hypothetical protein RUM43_004210 [Polyplax serrata]|uniref:RNA polymerase II-associated protein 3 n=1 Tax=Polyplax serrata TaxID=468196 RepID=A0AAN8SAN0_POLSC